MTLEDSNDSLFPHLVSWNHRSMPRLTEDVVSAMDVLTAIRRRKDLHADMTAWLKEHDIVHTAQYGLCAVSFVQLSDAVQFHMAFAERAPSL